MSWNPRRARPGRLAAIAALWLTVGLPGDRTTAAESPAKRPVSFVIILVDDLGWMDLSCQRSRYSETPHIDRLAAQGMRFTNGYAAMVESVDDAAGELDLFNLADDLGETKDLSKEMPEKVQQLDEQLTMWLRSTGAKLPKPNPEYAGKAPPKPRRTGSGR